MIGPRWPKGKALRIASFGTRFEMLPYAKVLPGAHAGLLAREPAPCPDAFKQPLHHQVQFPLPFGQKQPPTANALAPLPDANAGGVPLAAVVCTGELKQRPARAPDYESENRALLALAQAMADSPATILETLAETLLKVLQIGSAGISLLAKDGQNFVWSATAGLWRPYVGGSTPRHFSPSGDVLDGNAPLLFQKIESRYTYLLGITPRIEEALLVPFFIKGKAVGSIWALSHDNQRKFDAEDLRQLESLSCFAAGAYSALECVNSALCMIEENRRSHAEVQKLSVQLTESALLYSALFESIDEGFCILEKTGGSDGEALDFRYVQANPACALQQGLAGLVGQTIRQQIPDACGDWLQFYETALRTGKAERFERQLASIGRVLQVHAFRIEDETQRRIGVSFRDVTERKAADDVLRHRTAQFETLLNQAPLGVYLIDSDLRICHANPGARAIFKHITAPVGQDFDAAVRDLYPAAAADKIMKRFRHTLATGEPWEVPQWVERRNDNQPSACYEWQINRITLPDGRYGVVCYFRNISEQVKAEQHLRDAEERYRNLFNAMDEGFCIIEMIFDAQQKAVDYRFIEVNPAFEKQSGMQGVVGRRVREMIPDLEEHWFEAYGKVALTGKPVRLVNEVKAHNSWVDIYAARLGETPNSQVAVIFNNITERIKTEEALRSSEQRFRALFDRGPLAMYTVDAAGTVQEFNRVAVELWGREPVRGDPVEKFCGAYRIYRPDGSGMPHEQTPVAAVLKGAIAFVQDVEVTIERPDGSRINVIANIVPLMSADGEITGAINCLYDVTERSRTERLSHEHAETLADLHRRKDEFLAMLSHELRSPLAPIANSLQLLRLQKNEEPMQRQARQVIERQVGQLKNLVDDLLEVARITSGRVQLRRDEIDARGIVESAVETARPSIAQKRHTLEVSLPEQPVWLHVDASRLEQVMINLLTNAAKYTDEGGCIFLGLKAEGEEAVFRVRDNGIGIAPELLPRVFDLFTQADRSLNRSQGGMGIGLSLVRQLVDLHGGTVTASSRVGQGSEFTVRLPLLHTAYQPSLAPFADTQSPSGNGCRVLVVDDNTDSAQSLANLLELSGHETRRAHDGASALKAALAWRPEAVLLDIGLPGLNGFEVATQIRQDPALASMLLVALTGYGQEADMRRSREAGFDHHLVKPANFAEIEKILASVPQKAC